LQSADFRQAPLIDPNFIADPDDLRVAAEGVRISREIMQQQAFAKYIRREHFPGESVSGTNALKEYVKQYGRTSYHPNGTCKMGQDAMAVVDPQLKVRGIEGLRVIDSSIFPSLIGSNTNAPTIMVAEKGADLVRSA
jgi:choline dehydrogenase-like flavoprotein